MSRGLGDVYKRQVLGVFGSILVDTQEQEFRQGVTDSKIRGPQGVGARGDPTPGAGLSTKASCSSCSFCSRSAIYWNIELLSSGAQRKRDVGIVCEDLKEGPQMGVRIKGHIGIGVRGQQLS